VAGDWHEPEQWRRVQKILPIACVDVLLLHPTPQTARRVEALGLILRDTPHQGRRWCLVRGSCSAMRPGDRGGTPAPRRPGEPASALAEIDGLGQLENPSQITERTEVFMARIAVIYLQRHQTRPPVGGRGRDGAEVRLQWVAELAPEAVIVTGFGGDPAVSATALTAARYRGRRLAEHADRLVSTRPTLVTT